MGDGLRTIHLVTGDEGLLAAGRAAAADLAGWEFQGIESVGELEGAPPAVGDVILLDAWLQSENVYEACRRLLGKTRCRTYVIATEDPELAAPIARFCGATGALPRPLTSEALRAALEATGGPRPPLPQDARAQGTDVEAEVQLPQSFLEDLVGDGPRGLIDAVTDPETGLFSYEFLKYKLDEEFKRARRFQTPLACVRLGFDGQADEGVLRKLASIFLLASRDTDVLGRFDESSFLFFLPHTGPDGAAIMARRITALAEEQGLLDLIGDPLDLAVGISSFPHSSIKQRDDLFGQACEAYDRAMAGDGGAIITAS